MKQTQGEGIILRTPILPFAFQHQSGVYIHKGIPDESPDSQLFAKGKTKHAFEYGNEF